MIFMSKFTKIALILTLALGAKISFASEGTKSNEPNETSSGHHEEKFIIYHQPQQNSTLGVAPDRPKLTSPAPLANINSQEVLLKWSPSEEADAYALQVSDDANFFKIIINEPMLDKTEFTATGLEKDKIYYWRVAALKTKNNKGFMKSLYNRSSFNVK